MDRQTSATGPPLTRTRRASVLGTRLRVGNGRVVLIDAPAFEGIEVDLDPPRPDARALAEVAVHDRWDGVRPA